MSHETLIDSIPFQPLVGIARHHRISDAEYIEATRKSLRRWDRWRWVGVLLFAGMLAALVALSFSLIGVVQSMVADWLNLPGQNLIAETLVLVGVGIGASLGFAMHHCLWSLIMALSGMRSERLLVRYHAAFGDLPKERD